MSLPGSRILPSPPLADAQLVEALRSVVTPHISDNLGRHIGARGLTRFNRTGKLVGTALTVKTRPGDNLYIYKALTLLQPGHVLVFGSDNQWFKGQDDVLIIDNNKAEAHALYSQLRPQIDALPDWHPSIGLRHETMSGGDSATVGMLTSLYDLNANWALRGQYGSAYKLPNAEQLFVNEPGDEIGNRNLKPEKSRNAELGLDYKGLLADREFSASVTLFKRKITDLITLDDSHWVNGQGQIQVRGFEADAKLALNHQWSLQADMTRNLTESRAGVTLNDVPSFFARSRVGFESQNRLWGAGAAIRYIHDVISSKRVEYGHYSVVDADAYRYLDNAHQHRVSLLVENLFDRDYVTSRSSNVDNLGRPFTTEVRYTYRF